MPCLAAIYWGYITLAVLAAALVVASPFLVVVFRSARAIAYTKTDDFRLSNANMWTEPHHNPDGGSLQLMRLKDGHFVMISVGVSSVKIFTTPDRADIAQYREIQEFPVHSVLDRMAQRPDRRRSEAEQFLDHVRREIGWPESVTELVSSVQSIDPSLLRNTAPNA